MAEVFISYARMDQGFARDLNHALQKLKRDTWIDWRSIPDSAEWRAEIFAAIDAADNFLFIISPDSLRSEMCKLEVAHALANKKRVITILHTPVDSADLFPGLGEIQWINYYELGFAETFPRLIAALDTDRVWVRQHTRLAEKGRDWENNKRNESFLLRGMALQEAIEWLARSTVVNEPKLLPLHEEYIRASQKWVAGEILRLRESRETTASADEYGRAAKQRRREERSKLAAELALLVKERRRLAAQKGLLTKREHQRQAAEKKARVEQKRRERRAAAKEERLARLATEQARMEQERKRKVWAVNRSRVFRNIRNVDGFVYGVSVSADGRLAVSASSDSTLKVWNVESGHGCLQGHSSAVNTVALAVGPAGPYAVSGSDDNTLKLWNVENGDKQGTLKGHTDAVRSVAVIREGRLVISASDDQTLKVWDVESRRELQTLRGHTGAVLGVAVTVGGRRAVSVSADKTLKVWDLIRACELGTLRGHSDWVRAVGVSADGLRAVSASDDNTLKVWSLESGSQLRTLRGHSDSVYGVAVSVDGRHAVSASEDQTLKLWDLKSGLELASFVGNAALLCCAVSSNENAIVAGGRDGRIYYVLD